MNADRTSRLARIAALADLYRLAVPRQPVGGVAGAQLGSAVGNSLEFQDHRAYFPGDDLRHIDWAAYARTDQLTVRLYREEVAPRLELLADASASMTTGRKAEALADLLTLLIELAGRGSAHPVLYALGDGPVVAQAADLAEAVERLSLTGREPMAAAVGGGPIGLRPRSIRVVISDFLFPHEADGLVSRLADRAASIALIQLLSAAEADPPAAGATRLQDVETAQWLEVNADAAAVARYRGRLAALQTGLSRAARRAGGSFCSIVDETDLSEVCRRSLAPAGVLEFA